MSIDLAKTAKMQICSELGLRRLWHTNCPAWMPESRRGQNTSAIMQYVKPEESIPHDDGSPLYLAECLHCGARGYIGVAKDRHIIVRDVARLARQQIRRTTSEAPRI